MKHVKDVIYNEEGQDALTDAVAMFDNGQGGIELQNVSTSVGCVVLNSPSL